MRAFKFLNLAILSALIASSAALYAQDEKQENKPPRQEEPRREPKQDEMKPPKQDEAKPSKEERREERSGERQSGEQMKPGEHAQQGSHARPTGKSAHIPEEKFRAQFGRSHTFKAPRPQLVEGQPQFVYGGYSFVLIDPWPMEWAYADDVYVDYVDGDYFLYNLAHPGVRIALFVVM